MSARLAILGTRGYPYVYSGYETFVRELVERLGQEYEIHVYCHRGLFRERPAVVKGVRLHYVPGLPMKSFSQLTHTLCATWHALVGGYDIYFYANTANGPFGWFLSLFGKLTVINTDGIEWKRPKWKGFGARYFYWASGVAARHFKALVCDSREMARIYREEFHRDSEVIAYGANIGSSSNPALVRQLGLEERGYYLIVGRLVPDNNADLLIEGFLRSASNRKLVVVGDVPYRDAYAQKLKSLASPQVVFTGYVEDQRLLTELYANSYCYLHGHEYGGTNPTLLKALACGCCVLALDTPFSREVLEDEAHGMYFHKLPQDVADCVRNADLNPRKVEAYRANARERIRSCYTWERIARQYRELFQRLLSANEPSHPAEVPERGSP